jgi:hypothetical protein
MGANLAACVGGTEAKASESVDAGEVFIKLVLPEEGVRLRRQEASAGSCAAACDRQQGEREWGSGDDTVPEFPCDAFSEGTHSLVGTAYDQSNDNMEDYDCDGVGKGVDHDNVSAGLNDRGSGSVDLNTDNTFDIMALDVVGKDTTMHEHTPNQHTIQPSKPPEASASVAAAAVEIAVALPLPSCTSLLVLDTREGSSSSSAEGEAAPDAGSAAERVPTVNTCSLDFSDEEGADYDDSCSVGWSDRGSIGGGSAAGCDSSVGCITTASNLRY